MYRYSLCLSATNINVTQQFSGISHFALSLCIMALPCVVQYQRGIKYPFAAAGGLANKTPLLRNVALFSPAFAFRPQAVAAFADEKRRCFSASPFCLRRVRDSNPRTREGQRFSRPPRSTTLPTLRGKNTTFFRSPHTPPKNFYPRLLFNILSYICKENNTFLFIS